MNYYPILLSKAGELKALQELSGSIVKDICPVVEVLAGSIRTVEKKLSEKWTFSGNSIILDFSLYADLQNSIGEIEILFINLFNAGINVIPAIQNGINQSYIDLVKGLIENYNCKICIRSSNANGGLINHNIQIKRLITQLNATSKNIVLLIDLGYVQDFNYSNFCALAISVLDSISNLDEWADIVVASGSFPVDVSHLSPNAIHRQKRHEWEIWKTLNLQEKYAGIIKYSDYGNKNPVYSGESNRPGSCSIKYITENDFVIYRGVLSDNHPDGNGQYITFASKLISTSDYYGVGFSWGDYHINRIAKENILSAKRKTGSATTWVEITQNHHMTLLNSLL